MHNYLPTISLLIVLFSATSCFAQEEDWQTELDEDVSSLMTEIQERVLVLNRLESKIAEIDHRIDTLEDAETIDRARIRALRKSRMQLAELHGVMKINAEQALSIIEAYSQQLSELLQQTDASGA